MFSCLCGDNSTASGNNSKSGKVAPFEGIYAQPNGSTSNNIYNRLSIPYSELKNHYDVVVIGSGYGASIAACRSARAGLSVCVLEKGKEFQPGQYPESRG